MNYQIEGACKSVIGCVRSNNEDNYYFNSQYLSKDNTGDREVKKMYFNNKQQAIAAVFDGMGGESNGEVASFLGASTLGNYLKSKNIDTFSWQNYIERANNVICNEMSNIRMGTTIAGVYFNEENMEICNLGDSKIFGLINNKLIQLSVDHTDKKIKDKLQIEKIKSYKLTQHLGIKKTEMVLEPYIKKIDYSMFDSILVCSDGLTDMVSASEIENILNLDISVSNKVDKLISIALNNGGYDNITIMIFKIKNKKSIKYPIIILSIVLLIIILSIIMINKKSFKIIIDNCDNTMLIDQTCQFKYRGDFNIQINNDNIIYQDGTLIAKKVGISTLSILSEDGSILYEKIVKVFPK